MFKENPTLLGISSKIFGFVLEIKNSTFWKMNELFFCSLKNRWNLTISRFHQMLVSWYTSMVRFKYFSNFFSDIRPYDCLIYDMILAIAFPEGLFSIVSYQSHICFKYMTEPCN